MMLFVRSKNLASESAPVTSPILQPHTTEITSEDDPPSVLKTDSPALIAYEHTSLNPTFILKKSIITSARIALDTTLASSII